MSSSLPYHAPHRTLAEAVATVRRELGRTTVPIYLAAIGRRAMRLAGTIADGVVLNAYIPVGYVPWAIREIEDGARAAGRFLGSPRLGYFRHFATAVLRQR